MPYYEYFHHPNNNFGIVVFSKYKIVKREPLFLPISITNGSVYCELDIHGKRVGLISYHLYSYNFRNIEGFSQMNYIQKGLVLNRLVKNTYKRQEAQLNGIMEYAKSINLPLIIAGDLNNIPDSYFYHQLTANYKDSFMEKGRGRGLTYPLLSVRIDYQFCSPQMKVLKHEVLKSEFSDHYPVLVSYGL